MSYDILLSMAADVARLRSDMASSRRVVEDFSSQAKNLLGGVFAGFSAGVVIREFVQTADAVNLMNARLKLVTGTVDDFQRAQADVYRIAQANNVGLQETAALYTKLAGPVQRLGGSTKEVAGIVEAFAASLRVGGASAQEASAATLQFAQAMAAGRLQGDEFRSLAEASPRFMKALADGMGVPIERLKEMSKEGELTAEVIGNALLKGVEQLRAEAGTLPDTVGGAFQRVKNEAMVAAAAIDEASGASKLMAQVVGGGAGMLGEFAKVLRDVYGGSKDAGDGISFLAEVATRVLGTAFEAITVMASDVVFVFKGIGTEIGGIAAQLVALAQFDFERVGTIRDEMITDAKRAREELDRFQAGIVGLTDRVLANKQAITGAAESYGKLKNATGATADETKKAAAETKRMNDALADCEKIIEQDLNKQMAEAARNAKEWAREAEALERESRKLVDALDDQARQLVDGTAAMQRETAQLGLSKTAVAELEAARYEEIAALKEREAQSVFLRDGLTEEYRALLDLASAYRGRAEAIRDRGAVEAEQAAIKQSADAWKQLGDDISKSLTDAMVAGFESGKSIARSVGDWIANYFKTSVARTIAQALTAAIGSVLSGVASAAGFDLGGLIGGGGGGGGLGGLLNLGGLVGGGSSLFGLGLSGSLATIGEMGFFGGAGNVLTSAGSLLSGGSITGALGAAAPYLLPVAAAAFGLSKLLGDKSSPAQQQYSIVDTGAGVGDYFRQWAPNLGSSTAYESTLQQVVGSINEIVSQLGGTTAQLAYGIFTSASPDGKGALSQVDIKGAGGGSVYFSELNAANETLMARLEAELPHILLTGLQQAALPEEYRQIFGQLDLSSASAQQIGAAVEQALALQAQKNEAGTAADQAAVDTYAAVQANSEVLLQQVDWLGKLHAAVEQLAAIAERGLAAAASASAEAGNRVVRALDDLGRQEVNGGVT